MGGDAIPTGNKRDVPSGHITVYNQEVIKPERVAMLTDAACRHALNHRVVAHHASG